MNNEAINCVGVVLAGGLSSRMGTDKSQLSRLKNTNMLDYSKQLLGDAGISNIVISGSDTLTDKLQIADLVPKSGPVGGIYSVIAHYQANTPLHLQPKAFLILPVDLPLMTGKALAELKLKGELTQKACFFQDANKRDHHIPLYLPNNAFLSLYLAKVFIGDKLISTAQASQGTPSNMTQKKKGGPSVRSMLEQIPHQQILLKNSKALFNTNTPQEWQQAQQDF